MKASSLSRVSVSAITVSTFCIFAADNSALAETDSTALEEIVVTAQKRVENAQKAPLTVTSLTSDALESAHVTGPDDLQRVVPDVTVDSGGVAGDPGGVKAEFTIRGLGGSPVGPQGSPGVAVHFDGVFRQNGISNDEFYDLERIEVDPGPQGTLYGRSAAAGAVNVIPNKPTDHFEGLGTIEVGNYGEYRSVGMINIPLDSTLSIRAALQTQNHDGYFTNGYDDEEAYSGRFQALYKPNDALSIRLFADYVHFGGRGTSDVFVAGPTFSTVQNIVPQIASTDPFSRSIGQDCLVNGIVTASCLQNIDDTRWSAHLDASYDFGWGVVTVLPSYNKQESTTLFANAPLPFAYYSQVPDNEEQKSLEVRLNDAGNTAVKWVAGVSAFENQIQDTVTQSIDVLTGPLPVFGGTPPHPVGAAPGVLTVNGTNSQQSQQSSYGIFGQTTYPVLDWLRLTAGGRYNYDSSSYAGTLTTTNQTLYYLNAGPFPPALAGAQDITSPIVASGLTSAVRFRALTYRFAVDADITPTSLVYGSIGSGYKPGSLNDGGPASGNTPATLGLLGSQLTPALTAAQVATYEPSQSYGPEKVTHYELGFKNRFFNNRLQINDSLYYDDYRSYQNGQTQVVNPLIFRVQGFVITNAGAAKVYGNELAIKYKLTSEDLLSASANLLHATFKSYLAPAYLSPSGTVPGANYAGYRLPNAPEASGDIAYQHFFDLPDGGQLAASVFTHLSGAYWVLFSEAPGTHQGSYTRTTLDLSWTSPNQRYSLTGFVNNLEDRTIISFGNTTAGYTQVHYQAPRLFGFSFTGKF